MHLNILYSIFIVVLIIFSSFFSGCETAITSLKPYQWNASNLPKKKPKTSWCILKMLNNYSLTLGATLIGNTICNIISSSLVTLLVELNYGNSFVAAATGILTFIVLIFGEYLPKSIARMNPVKFLSIFGIVLILFYWLFMPLCYVFNLIFERKKKITASENDLNHLISTIEKEGVLEKQEASMVKKAMQFDETPIEKVFIKKYSYVNITDTFDEIFKKFNDTKFSRLPVLNKKDICKGFILNKDILQYALRSKQEKFNIKNFIKPIPSISKNLYLDDAFLLMQRNNSQMLSVYDPKKPTKILGIITMEMIIEQIVGQIYDEKDQLNNIQIINDFTWIVNSNVNAYNFFKKFFNKIIHNKKIDISEYFKKTFRVKKIKRNSVYENKQMKVTILKINKRNKIKYEIIKK